LHVKNYGVVTLELDEQKARRARRISSIREGRPLRRHDLPPRDRRLMVQARLRAGHVAKATSKPITNEANNGLKNDKYTVAMARTNDPHSASRSSSSTSRRTISSTTPRPPARLGLTRCSQGRGRPGRRRPHHGREDRRKGFTTTCRRKTFEIDKAVAV